MKAYKAKTKRAARSIVTSICLAGLFAVGIAAQANDGAILFMSTMNTPTSRIYKMNSDGTGIVQLTNTTFTDAGGIWSPDKTKIVFQRFQSTNISQVWLMNADGTGQTQLTNGSETNQNPFFSRDGSKIYFSKCDTVNFVCDLYTMNPDGTGATVHPASDPSGDDDIGSISPDGTTLAYMGMTPSNQTKLMIAAADGSGTPTAITTNVFPVIDLYARISPDNSKVVFTHYSNYNSAVTSEIYVVNIDGTGLTQLTNNTVADLRPMWSPDGTKIMFASSEGGDHEIFIMNADGTGRTPITANTSGEFPTDWYIPVSAPGANDPQFDFDDDGRSDISVFRPASGMWYLDRSTEGMLAFQFGAAGDITAPADYDGDGRTDVAVWRESEGNFYIFNSSDNSIRIENFGLPGDILTVGNWDADDKADLSVYREGAQGVFYYRGSSENPNGNITFVNWGSSGDKPVIGDFDGDGKQDVAVFRPATGIWYMLDSSDGSFKYAYFGLASDMPVPADYDGDGKTDIAVFRNGTWYVLQSSNGQVRAYMFGIGSDLPVPADYDGDGKADVAVFRGGVWYLNQSTDGFAAVPFGTAGDVPIPHSYIGQ